MKTKKKVDYTKTRPIKKYVHNGFSLTVLASRYYQKLGITKYEDNRVVGTRLREDRKLNVDVLNEVVREMAQEQIDSFNIMRKENEKDLISRLRKKINKKGTTGRIDPVVRLYISNQRLFDPSLFYAHLAKKGVDTKRLDKQLKAEYGDYYTGLQFIEFGLKNWNTKLREKTNQSFDQIVTAFYRPIIKKMVTG
jgi:hypothetical protein